MYIAPFIANVGIQEYSLSVLYTWCNKAKNSAKTLSNIKYFDCWHPRRLPFYICCNEAKNSVKTLLNIKYFHGWHPRRTPFCILHLVPHSADWRRRKQLLGDYTATCFEGIKNQEKSLLFYTCCRPQYIIQRLVFEGIKNEEEFLLFYTCYRPKQSLGHGQKVAVNSVYSLL